MPIPPRGICYTESSGPPWAISIWTKTDKRYSITSRYPRGQPSHQEHLSDPSHDAGSRASRPVYCIKQLQMMTYQPYQRAKACYAVCRQQCVCVLCTHTSFRDLHDTSMMSPTGPHAESLGRRRACDQSARKCQAPMDHLQTSCAGSCTSEQRRS